MRTSRERRHLVRWWVAQTEWHGKRSASEDLEGPSASLQQLWNPPFDEFAQLKKCAVSLWCLYIVMLNQEYYRLIKGYQRKFIESWGQWCTTGDVRVIESQLKMSEVKGCRFVEVVVVFGRELRQKFFFSIVCAPRGSKGTNRWVQKCGKRSATRCTTLWREHFLTLRYGGVLEGKIVMRRSQDLFLSILGTKCSFASRVVNRSVRQSLSQFDSWSLRF